MKKLLLNMKCAKLYFILFFTLSSSLLAFNCSAQVTAIVNFDGGSTPQGQNPGGSLVRVRNLLYGMTYSGGANNYGCIFSADTNGNNYRDLWDFDRAFDSNGANPYGSLTLSGGKLYGMTSNGGINAEGNIFRIDTNGGGYKNLWSFHQTKDSNGAGPYGSLILSGTKLYGMTQYGGINNFGNIFRIDTNGGGYKNLWNFNQGYDSNGEHPQGDLTLSGGKLYGMTSVGGINAYGNIFRIDTNGDGYKNLWNFHYSADSNGTVPYGSLTLSGGKLYGMTYEGGTSNYGNIFRIDTNGKGYKNLWNFNVGSDTNGVFPHGSLSLSGGKLYGMTELGGKHDSGVIFNIDTNGKGYKDLFNFTGIDGGYPFGSLILSGNVLYGMAYIGGANDDGVVFRYDTNAVILEATMGAPNAPPCNGGTGKATVTAVGGTPPYTYSWAPSGGTNALATGLSAGSYTVTVKDHNGHSTTASVVITQPIAISITIHSTPDNGTHNGTASVTVGGGTLPYTYSWSPGGKTTAAISGESAGTYCCTVKDAHGCTDSACVTIKSTAGINSITSGAGEITIYPNPSGGLFTLRAKSEAKQSQSTIEVYNVIGEQVYSTPLNLPQGGDFEINLSSQPSGIYLYRVITDDGSLVGEGKMIIQR